MKTAARLVTLFLLLLTGACSEPHEYAERTFAGAVDSSGELRLDVVFRAGDVRLTPAEGPEYSATFRYCTLHSRPEVSFDPGGEAGDGPGLSVGLPALEDVFFGFGGERNSLSLVIPRSNPVSMDLDFAGGDALLDLAGVELRRLHLDTGVGRTRVQLGTTSRAPEQIMIEGLFGDVSVTGLGRASPEKTEVRCGVGRMHLDLGGEWRFGGRVFISASAGDLSLRLPSSIPVSLEVGAPWSGDIELDGYEHRQVPVSGSQVVEVERVDRWFSEGYDTATRRLELTLEAGTGQLRIEQEEVSP